MNGKYKRSGSSDSCVISTEIGLARNLADYPFPCRMSAQARREVCGKAKDCFSAVSGLNFSYYDMRSVPRKQALAFAERRLISPEFAVGTEERGVLISEDETVSIMLCGEDHIFIRVIKPGLDTDGAYKIASALDDVADQALGYAFSKKYGYLTQCPANLGTAMHACLTLHLPALAKTEQTASLIQSVSRLGLTVRGAYGEGTQAKGDVFRVSNHVTLGISERAAMDNLKTIALQITTLEHKTCDEYTGDVSIRDRINRAYGILMTARLLSTEEMLDLFSWVRLGSECGLLETDIEKLNELTETMQAATLNTANGGDLGVDRRDELRASMVREALFPGTGR